MKQLQILVTRVGRDARIQACPSAALAFQCLHEHTCSLAEHAGDVVLTFAELVAMVASGWSHRLDEG